MNPSKLCSHPWPCCWSFTVSLLLCATSVFAEESPPVDFNREIQPLLSNRCLRCHGSHEPEGGLSLTKPELATVELPSGNRAISVGNVESSVLLERVTSDDPDLRMPPEGPRLSDQEVKRLRTWIAQGADWPQHWAYRPLSRPALPSLSKTDLQWCRNPVDFFVLKQLRDRGLTPSEEADHRTLLRRLYFDLIGMPPTPAEFEEFLKTPTRDTYEQVVDRLLGSPHYGERWARHWMDLVHYAETHGHDQDRPRENAWPYRDYLIRSFNSDKSYRRFVREQVAGDAWFGGSPDAIVATGLLATGPWDESSLRDIREDSLDREIARYIDRDDIVTTVMSTFVSTTVHCARCHDHKFDPISQREYYGLQAVFAGTDKANREYDPDTEVAQKRLDLAARLEELERRVERGDPALLTEELQQELAVWEAAVKKRDTWQAAVSDSIAAAEGSEFTRLDDGSYLTSGDRPDQDTYTLELDTGRRRVSALKLEVMTDASLPKQGPGRQDNGNLHLNEIRVWQVLDGQPDQPLKLGRVEADFNQEGWSIEKAIDGEPSTAWGIYPRVGESHAALFELASPPESESSVVLKVELQQSHGGGHLIGRVRLSTADSPTWPLSADVLPAPITAILNIIPEERTDDQRIQLAANYLRYKLTTEQAALPAKQLVYCGTNQFQADGSFRPSPRPRTVHLLRRGNIKQPESEASPESLHFIAGLGGTLKVSEPEDEGQRRVALAAWLTADDNGLAWRSAANRIWQYHFGRPLVDTPNDFGRMGAAPTHPQLLDWLAIRFRDGWTWKQIHRAIVTSSTYRQASTFRSAAAAQDADNRFLWRMNRRRLDAESVRDALLRLSETLDSRMGGPSVKQFVQSPGVHVTPKVDYAAFDPDAAGNYRRSVYRFVFRTVPDPFMDAMDCPDASQLTPKRNTSVTALQALALLHDKFIVRQSQHLADRISHQHRELTSSEGHLRASVDACFQLLLGRAPSLPEQTLVMEYAAEHGLANTCRFLVNTNEFLFLD